MNNDQYRETTSPIFNRNDAISPPRLEYYQFLIRFDNISSLAENQDLISIYNEFKTIIFQSDGYRNRSRLCNSMNYRKGIDYMGHFTILIL